MTTGKIKSQLSLIYIFKYFVQTLPGQKKNNAEQTFHKLSLPRSEGETQASVKNFNLIKISIEFGPVPVDDTKILLEKRKWYERAERKQTAKTLQQSIVLCTCVNTVCKHFQQGKRH